MVVNLLTFDCRKILKLENIGKPVSPHTACSFISRRACLLHTSSEHLRNKWDAKIKLKKMKKIVSDESKRKAGILKKNGP